VGVSKQLTTPRVRPTAILARASTLAVTTRSPPITALASPVAMRTAWRFGPVGDADVAEHRAALLGQAGHVEHGDALAVEVGGHADQRADGDHAGAADAGDEDAPRLAGGRQRGAGAKRSPCRPRALAHPAASTVTKLGQKPFMHE
jgi:hypothetical protein